MAEEKKLPETEVSAQTASVGNGTEGAQASAALGNENPTELELAERLKAAEGSIDRHNEDVRARKTEQEKNREKAEIENKNRIEQEERAREERAKQARLVAEQKLAAYEYAHNYRKKLKKDKERAKSQAKIRQEEERAAAKEKAREAEALEIEKALAEERADAEARNERVTALLELIKNGAQANEQTPSAEIPAAAEEAPAVAEPAADTPAEEPVADAADRTEAEDDAPAEQAAPVTDSEQTSDDDDGMFVLDFVNEGEEDDGVLVLDDAEKLAKVKTEGEPRAQKLKVAKAPEAKKPEQPKRPAEKTEPMIKRPTPERAAPEKIPPLDVEDDIVALIKALGRTVEDKKALKKYLKKSKRAVAHFLDGIARTEKYIGKCADENSLPELTVDTVVKQGKIVEIRCDNVSTCARLGETKYTDKCAQALSEDIEDYNSRVASFNSLTGEHLTRVSAFLPEHLANGTGRALIPKLAYRDNYIEIDVDESGAPVKDSGNVTTVIVAPPFTSRDILGEIAVDSKGEASSYYKKAEKARRRFDTELSRIRKQIIKTDAAADANRDKEKDALEARESAVRLLNGRYPKSSRKEAKYQKKLSSINNKYGKTVLRARRERAEQSYEQKSLRMLVECFAIEREKVVTFADLISEIRVAAKSGSLAAAKRDFVEEMRAYNARSEEISEIIGKPLSLISGALADSIARGGAVAPIPKMACRRELIETVGDKSRIIGDRIKTRAGDAPLTARHDSGENLFDKDKSLEERALLREQIMVKALDEKSKTVEDRRGYKKYLKKSKYTVKKLKRTLRQTDKAIFKAVDNSGVIVALVENIRILGKLVWARCINLETAVRVGARTGKLRDRLYEEIEKYNSRALDYQKVSGKKLTRVSAFLPENISNDTGEAVVPSLSYRETYIEAYPLDNRAADTNSEYGRRGAGLYLPLDYKYRRITENNTVEVTEIAPPVFAEDEIDRTVVDTRAEFRSTRWQAFRAEWKLGRALKRVERRQRRNKRRAKRFDKKLARLNKRYDSSLFKMESLVPELQRQSPEYRAKLDRAAEKYKRATVKLRYKRVKRAIERYGMKLAAEEFVIRRERVAVLARKLLNFRTYERPSPINDARNDLINEIRDYNRHARDFSAIIGEPITEISASIADDILRNGKSYPLPKMLLCREIIETVGERARVVGDKYRFGMPVQINAQGIPVMTGTNIVVENVGSAQVGLRSDGTPVIGATDTGLPYAGAPDKTLTAAARRNPAAQRTATFSTNAPLSDPLDALDSDTETVVAGEVGELDRYIGGAVKSKSYSVYDWHDLIRYKRRSRKAKRRIVDVVKAHNSALRNCEKIDVKMGERVQNLATGEVVRLIEDRDATALKMEELKTERENIISSIAVAKAERNRRERRELERELENIDGRLGIVGRALFSAERAVERAEDRIDAAREERDGVHSIYNLLYLRKAAALGRVIELECMDLYAAAKIRAGFFAKLVLLIRGCGFNPRKKAKKRLSKDIDKYNEFVMNDPAERGFSSISIMLPEEIAAREDTGRDLIPDLVFKERFTEESRALRGGRLEAIPSRDFSDALDDFEEITGRRDYKQCMSRLDRISRDIDRAKRGVSNDARTSREELEDIREKKQRLTAKYDRAVLRISRRTHGTVEYQRKMRKKLNRYRKKMLKLNRKERTPRINVKKWVRNYRGYNDQGLMYGLSGRVRIGSIIALALERERLISACKVLLLVRDADVSERRKRKYRGKARKQLIDAMVKYNRAADECSARIREKLWRAPSSLPTTVLREGVVPNIPRVMCSVQTFEALGDSRNPID